MVSGLKIRAVAVAWVAGLTAAAGALHSASVAAAPKVAKNILMSVPTLTGPERTGIVTVPLTRTAYGFAQYYG